jgi:tRNA threonylcarbamoyladenosine biosynthesis protein TsaB
VKILCIDTATPIEILTASNGTRIADASAQVSSSHAVSLFSGIDHCLKNLDISIHEMQIIGVGIGPGSFTGIRIAVSTARMLSQLLRVPLVGVPSPLIFAASCPAQTGENILVGFDAKKGRLFGALYKKKSGTFEPEILVPPGDYPLEYLTEKIDTTKSTIAIGDGIKKYLPFFYQKIPGFTLLEGFMPKGESICAIVLGRYANSPSTDYESVLPLYTRKSDAELLKPH